MLVAINALPIRPGMTGIGCHAANLVETLALADEPEAYVLVGPDVTVQRRRGLYPLRVLPRDAQFEQLHLPGILRRLGVDVYHSTLPSCPVIRQCRAVVTLHDVIPLARPDLTTRGFAEYFETVVTSSLTSTDLVITVSEFSRGEIVRRLGVPAERVRVVHQTAARRFYEPVAQEERERVRSRYDLPDHYVLYVGSIERRKNTGCLVEAMATMPESELVLVGRVQEEFDLDGLVAQHGLASRARWLRYLPDADLPALYGMATVFVFPSLYEGFGLPVLEAMACGCPVVCSSATSLPEVGGDAVLYADPNAPDELAAQVGRVLGSRELQRELGERSLQRAAEFSPARYAAELLSIYKELVP